MLCRKCVCVLNAKYMFYLKVQNTSYFEKCGFFLQNTTYHLNLCIMTVSITYKIYRFV